MFVKRYERPVTPAEISRGLQELIDQIVPAGKPVYVDVHPAEGAQPNECFPLVEGHVARHGGDLVVGWSLWEMPSLFVEAEFHCVWQQPSGELLDIAPKNHPTARVLFLTDPQRNYESKQVNNVRRAVKSDPALISYLATFDAEFELMNRGSRASQHGNVELLGLDAAEYHAIQQQRAILYFQLQHAFPLIGAYQPCPCGSGKKVKWCHKELG